jgi:energy-coupling factor transporter transmembrane protein EcfT
MCMQNFITTLQSYKWLIAFTLAYTIPFTVYFLSRGNGEFIWYIIVVLVLMVLVLGTLPKSQLPRGIVWALSVWALLHLAGGSVRVGETVLYGLQLLPIYNGGGEMILLKYDQVVHAFGFGLSALAMLHFLRRYESDKNKIGVYIIAALAGMGLGVLNEIVEFIAVLLFPNNGVGGYVNTSLDLIFNTLGAAVAISVAWLRRPRA